MGRNHLDRSSPPAMTETQQQIDDAIMNNVDIAQIVSTIGLLFATLVLVGIEYRRWRPVIEPARKRGDWGG